ncbi:acetolactate synthase small subunit [Peptococcaceae bacterium]|nr:acetolactate synthase small subunit [Desulfotomaculum sp.]MCL0032679.1 acetolactate synthase small subunit [Peptococcaceae bacterium]MCL0067573.1 acetolactate synthase small subunit [Peptococcaceae bacterium]MCL0100549.1 acetolactate synthase small subunit [Peptococcaceae bacterium]
MLHTLAVLVENSPGVLARVAGLFSRRGFNIESLAVGKTDDPTVSRMTIVVDCDSRTLEQVTKQLHKLIDVIKISDITQDAHVERELVLIKVHAERAHRIEVMQIVEIFRARVVDYSPKSLIIEATGSAEKLNALIDTLRPYVISELVRTGKVAIIRGSKKI